MVDQRWFSREEGNKVYRRMAQVLAEKYGAMPIDELETGSWDSQVRIPVPGTDGKYSVVVKIARNSTNEWFTFGWEQGRIKVGKKRWFRINLNEDGWVFDESKLFSKIEEEMAALRDEYIQKGTAEHRMEEMRQRVIQELGIDEDSISMNSPARAFIVTAWGSIRVVRKDERRYSLIDIYLSGEHEINASDVIQILETLDNTLGESHEPR